MKPTITIQDVQNELDEYEESLKPAKAVLEEANRVYNEAKKQLCEPFQNTMDAFLDQRLVDMAGKPVRKNYLITFGKHTWLIVDRGIQILFGRAMNNPQVVAFKTKDSGVTTYGKSSHFCPSELNEALIIGEKEAADAKG